MLFTVDFPTGLANVQWRFRSALGAWLGAGWASTGVVAQTEVEGYQAELAAPAGAERIYWRASEIVAGETISYAADEPIEQPTEPINLAPVLGAIAALPTLAQIRTVPIKVEAPIVASGELRLNRGGAYKSADGRAIVFPFTGVLMQAVAPRLATVQLIIESTIKLQVLGAFTPTAEGVSCSFELSAAQTETLATGSCQYFVRAVTISGDPFDLAEGTATIRRGS